MTEELWTGEGGLPLFVRLALPEGDPRGQVVLLHGYSEHSGRYGHVLSALTDAGFAVAAPDHRGHGRTGPVLGVTPRHEVLMSDIDAIEAELAARVGQVPRFLVGSSFGGLLALRRLQLGPDRYEGAVLQAPAVAVPPDIPMAVVHMVRGLAKVAPKLPVRPFFKAERATRDEAFQRWMTVDPYTYRGWVRAETGANTFRLIRAVEADLDRVVAPVLITQGSEDLRVRPEVTEALAQRLTGPVERVVFDGLRHEAHQEPERDEVVGAWVRWLVGRTDAVSGRMGAAAC